MAQYIYGVLVATGKTISILDVPEERTNRAGWNCICPSCGLALTAKRGKSREAHFAHAFSYQRQGGCHGCVAESANETALHRLAKEIIAEELKNGFGTIEVPPVLCLRAEVASDDIPREIVCALPPVYEHEVNPLVYTDAHIEQWYEGYRPDIIVETSDGKYLVEILVTHAVQADKKKMAREKNLPLLEIDLKRFRNEPVEKDELRKYILSERSCKKWIVRPHEGDVLAEGEKYYASHPIVLNYRKQQEALKVLFDPNRYANTVKAQQGLSAKRREEAFSKLHFYQRGMDLPFFVNIPIPGEVIFWCDRRVWQSAIFDTQVFYRRDEASINIPNVFWNIRNHDGPFKNLPRIKVDHVLSDIEIDALGHQSDEALGIHVVRAYIKHLEKLGFIRTMFSKEWAKVDVNGSVVPPNEEYASALIDAIKSLGEEQFSPHVDVLLYKALAPYRKEEERKKAAVIALERYKQEEERRRRERERRRREEEERQRKVDGERESILQADYNQNKEFVKSKSGDRYVFCLGCNQPHEYSEMGRIGVRNLETGIIEINKGYCRRWRNLGD